MSNSDTIQIKRQVTVKTLVTDQFRERANSELSQELKLIETQLEQLEAQYQSSLQQLEALAQQGQGVSKQVEQLNREAQERRSQLSSLRIEVSTQLANLDKISNGAYIVTGILENLVDVRIGDNIYEKMRNAEVLIQDGVVAAINN